MLPGTQKSCGHYLVLCVTARIISLKKKTIIFIKMAWRPEHSHTGTSVIPVPTNQQYHYNSYPVRRDPGHEPP